MHSSLGISTIKLILLLAAFACITSAAQVESRDDTKKRAAYFLDNDPAGCSIVSLKISADNGTLSSPVRTPTGGKGLHALMPGGIAGPDSLFSQDSVVVSGGYLFIVNPGSNTLSMFSINKDDPWHPMLVGTPQDTLGEFPVSVAYSSYLKLACALNGGKAAGVTCFSVDHAKGLTPLDNQIHPFSKDYNQTTPPTGPPGTVSDIFFNPSSSGLFVSVKGIPGQNPGMLYTWPIINGEITGRYVTTIIDDLIIEFSGSFLGSDSKLLLTDAAFGAAILSVSKNFTITEVAHTVIPNQQAACWSVYSPRFDSAYVIQNGSPVITVLDPATGAIRYNINFTASSKGGLDSAIDRTWLYVLGSNADVAVISLEGSNSGVMPKQVQDLDLSTLGDGTNFQGFAVYPS